MGDRNLEQHGGGDRWSAAMDASADGIAILEDGEYVRVNDAYVEVHGYDDREEFLGSGLSATYTKKEVGRLEEDVFPLTREEGKWRGEVTGLRSDGTEFPKEITVSPMEEGGFVFVARDITEQKERERELERYEAFVKNSSDSITHISEDGEILYRNPSSERAEDEPGEMEGTGAFEHIHPEDRERVAEKFFSLISNPDKKTDSVEYRSQRADGTYEWVEAVATDQRDTDIGGVVVNTRVIDDRKKHERELERYETFIENSSDIVVHLDEDGTVIYHSPSAERIMGHGSGDRIGDSAFEYVHPDDRERMMDLFESVLSNEIEKEKAEFRARDTDGEYIWLEAVGTDQRDTEVGGFIINIRDISERKKREKQLERHEAFVENSSDIITHLDEDGTILYQSPSIERILGYGQDETVGDEVFGYVHPDDRQEVLDAFYTAVDDFDREVGFRIRGADGDYVWVEATGSDHTDTEAGGFIVNTREITERKRREKELERYEAFVENSSDVIIHVAEDGTSLYHSPGAASILSRDPKEMDGENIFERVHPDDRELVVEKFTSLLNESDKKVEDVEFRVRCDDGEHVWVEAAGADQTHTEFGGAVVSLRDISGRVGRRKELERYEAFVKSTSDVVTHMDEDGEVVYNSPSIEDVFGYTPDETVGDNAFEYVHPDDREMMMNLFESVLQGEDLGEKNTEFRIRRADGEYVWVEDAGGNQVNNELDGVVLNLRDITDRVERREELERYEAFLENSLDIFSVLDEEGRHIYNSPSIERILGYDRENHTGEYSLDYVHSDDRNETIRWFYSLVEDDKNINETELRYRDADGNYVWFEVIGTDKTGTEVDGVVFNARDITERKKRESELREEQQAMETVLSNIPMVVFALDEDGVFTRSQGKALSKIGLEPGEVVGESVYDMYEDRVLEDIERALSGERVKTTVKTNGRTFESWYEPVEYEGEGEGGEVSRVVGMAYDVTEREQREGELERYEAFIENSSDLIVHLDESGEMLYESPGTQNIFGHQPEINLGENVFQYVHPEDRERVLERFNEGLSQPEKTAENIELRLEDDDGEYVWLEAAGTDQRDTEVGGVIVSLRDISDRKERERELERYEAFIQNSSDIITHMDTDGTDLYQSPATERILGRDPEKRLGEDALKYIHPEDRERVTEKLDSLTDDPEKDRVEVEFRSEREDGEYVWLETVGVDRTDTEIGGIVANSRDVTERKRSKEKLKRSRKLLSHTERIADTGGWEYEVEDRNIQWTEGTYDIHGVSQDFELTTENIATLYHPEDRDELGRLIRQCINEKEPYEKVFRIAGNGVEYENDGVRWVRTSGVPITEDGEVVRIRGAVQDITEQKERERELRRSRKLLGQTERIADTGGWELDTETDELRWTDGTRKIHDVSLDYDPTVEEAIDFYHPEDKDAVREAVERCREEGDPYDEETRLITSEEMKWVRTLGEPVIDDGEVVKLRGAIQNITERKEREREIKEQKDQIDFFNSLLRHDMLNSMTVIGGSSDLLLEELSEDDETYEHAERISKHSTEIVELTERVRSVLRRLTEENEAEMSPTELTEVIEERVESLKETYPEVTYTTGTSEEVSVAADPFLNHVLDNVLINAVEHNDKDEPRVEVTVEDGEKTATVRVADNGPGIPDDEKREVFKQGTTGRTSGSVGFGLYYVEQMVSEYGGEIHVEDNEPEGSVFVMELPKAGHELTEAETPTGGD